MRKHQSFRLSHLMPNSWFYKLRDDMKIRPRNQGRTMAARSSSQQCYHGATAAATPRPLPLPPPPRKSYQQRAPPLENQPKVRTQEFAEDQHRSSLSRRSGGDGDEFPGLRLRPIRTRPAASTVESSAAASASDAAWPSSPRLRSRKSHVLADPSSVVVRLAGGATCEHTGWSVAAGEVRIDELRRRRTSLSSATLVA